MKISILITIAGAFFTLFPAADKNGTTAHQLNDITNEKFAEFLHQFPEKEFPFTIDIDDFKAYKNPGKKRKPASKVSLRKNNTTVYNLLAFIPDIEPSAFSRMGPPLITPIARFHPTETSIAVVYKTERRFGSPLDNWYNIIYFNKNGDVISNPTEEKYKGSFQIAKTTAAESITCYIDINGRIWKNKYTNIWEKDIQKHGITDNKITGYEIKNTAVYEMNENGLMVQLNELPNETKAALVDSNHY